jgi:MFS family permease
MQSALSKIIPISSASVLIQVAGATVTTAVAISLAARAADDEYAAIVVAAYSTGFALGCFLAPSTILRIGYIRAFAAAAALCTSAVILLDMFDGTFSWALLRFAIGANFAFMLAAADGWVNAQADDTTRGRVLALHSFFVGLGLVGSQLLLLTMDSGQSGFFR